MVCLAVLFFAVCVAPPPDRHGQLLKPAPAAAQRQNGYPAVWLTGAHCIHYEEVRAPWWAGWATHFIYGTRVESFNRGGMQIARSTWATFAPKLWPRDPARASRAQQLFVSWRIWIANGRLWGRGRIGAEWPASAAACGVR